jgi:hypothetical protein
LARRSCNSRARASRWLPSRRRRRRGARPGSRAGRRTRAIKALRIPGDEASDAISRARSTYAPSSPRTRTSTTP